MYFIHSANIYCYKGARFPFEPVLFLWVVMSGEGVRVRRLVVYHGEMLTMTGISKPQLCTYMYLFHPLVLRWMIRITLMEINSKLIYAPKSGQSCMHMLVICRYVISDFSDVSFYCV